MQDFDQNGDGIITVDELPEVLDSIGLKPSVEEIADMVSKVTTNDHNIYFVNDNSNMTDRA